MLNFRFAQRQKIRGLQISQVFKYMLGKNTAKIFLMLNFCVAELTKNVIY